MLDPLSKQSVHTPATDDSFFLLQIGHLPFIFLLLIFHCYPSPPKLLLGKFVETLMA
jgi:hypothetical protein